MLRIAKSLSINHGTVRRVLSKEGVPIREETRNIRRNKLNDGQRQEIAERHRRGASTRQLATRFQVSRSTICRVLKSRGVIIHDGQPWKYRNKLTERQKSEIIERYGKGENIYQLAEDFPISAQCIWKLLSRSGLVRSRRTTEGQKQEIVKRYGEGESTTHIADALGLCQPTVSKILKENDIVIRGDIDGTKYKHKLSETQKLDIVKRYENGESTHELAERFSVSQRSIWGLLKRRNVQMRDSSEAGRIYDCDHNYFENIDTEEKAYWLGFLMADGSVKRNQLWLTLARKDRPHIVDFRESLQSDHPIHDGSTFLSATGRTYEKSRFVITSDKMTDDLAKLGIIPNKTSKETFPDIDGSLARHFIRGVFDGDGSVGYYVRPYRRTAKEYVRRDSVFHITGNEPFLLEIQKHLCSVGLSRTKLTSRRGKSCTLAYGGINNFKRIYRYLYAGATVYLDRKKQKFEEAIFGDGVIEDSLRENVSSGIMPLDCF